jgi:DNA-binding response OmpR family regulator
VERTSGMATELPEDDLRFGDLLIRPRLQVVERDEVVIELSANQFKLLYFLALHPREVFSREELLSAVWHYDCVKRWRRALTTLDTYVQSGE